MRHTCSAVAVSPLPEMQRKPHHQRQEHRRGKEAAPVKLPAAPLSWPTTTGPANPPQLPMELMSASPAAAPEPVRIEVGSDQNVPMAAKMPSVASDSANMTRSSGPAWADHANAAPDTN